MLVATIYSSLPLTTNEPVRTIRRVSRLGTPTFALRILWSTGCEILATASGMQSEPAVTDRHLDLGVPGKRRGRPSPLTGKYQNLHPGKQVHHRWLAMTVFVAWIRNDFLVP